jgi:hypothetical protein
MMVVLEKNPDYRRTDPLGPGTGNRLPYIDKVKYVIMTNDSVMQAAFRTGKLDRIADIVLKDKETISVKVPTAVFAKRGSRNVTPLFMKLRLLPSTTSGQESADDGDGLSRHQPNLYNGLGDIISWPYYG